MAEPEILFEVDASKILAKLHLGGLQATSYDKNKEFLVNTGIKNDDPNAKPENPGNVEFDLGNSQGDYELGFVTEANYKSHNGLNVIIDQIEQLLAEFKTKPGYKEEFKNPDEDKSLLTKDEDRTKKENAKNLDYQDMLKKIRELLDQYQDLIQQAGIDFKDFNQKFVDDANNDRKKNSKEEIKVEDIERGLTNTEFAQYIESFIQLLKDKNEEYTKANSGKDEGHAKERTEAFKQLQAYLTVFVGPDMAKKIKEDNLVEIPISEEVKDSKSKALVANYEITPASDQEVEKRTKQNEADPKNALEKICFKIGYSIQIDK